MDVSAPWGWCRHESPPLCVRATYISPLCRWACFCFFCSYVRHLTHYLHSSLRPFPSPLLCCLTGIDFKVKTIEVDGKKVKLQVWSVGDSCSVSLISFPSLVTGADAPEPPAFCCVERGISSLISKSWWHCTIPDAHLVHSPVSPIHIALHWNEMLCFKNDWIVVWNLYELFWSYSISCQKWNQCCYFHQNILCKYLSFYFTAKCMPPHATGTGFPMVMYLETGHRPRN